MRVLITGATGLVGGEIIQLCHQSNLMVNYLTTDKDKLHIDPLCQGYLWNPKKGEIDTNCFENVEVIIHLAGATVAKRWTPSYRKEILESRVVSTRLLLKTVENLKSSVRHIVSASAIGIYQDSFQKYYMEDCSAYETGFLGNVVMQWETAVREFKDLGIEISLLRTGLVLSEKGGAFPKMVKPIRMGIGAFFGSGKQWQSWIHVEDLARMFIHVMLEEAPGVFNAVAPNPVSNEKMTLTIAEKLGKKIILPNVPKLTLKLILGEMHTLLFSSQRVCSKRIADTGFVFKYDNIKSAIDDLIH